MTELHPDVQDDLSLDVLMAVFGEAYVKARDDQFARNKYDLPVVRRNAQRAGIAAVRDTLAASISARLLAADYAHRVFASVLPAPPPAADQGDDRAGEA